MTRAVLAILFVLLPGIIAFSVSATAAYPAEVVFGLAVLISTVGLWFTELIPLPATALLVPVLIVLYGLSPAEVAFQPFANSIIFLFIGAFLLARAMQKHRWDQRMAYWVLLSPLASRSFFGLACALAGLSFVLSMWISNTATCAMLCPIVIGVLSVLEGEFATAEDAKRANVFLLLSVAYASSVGGIATPVGTPPNLITLGFLAERGIELTFLDWLQIAAPISFTMLLLLLVVLYLRYPVHGFDREKFLDIREHLNSRLMRLGAIRQAEIQVAVCFGIAVVLWMLPGVLKSALPESTLASWVSEHLPMSTVALLAGLLLFFLPIGSAKQERNLEWADAKHIDWGTVILFGGGLSLGAMLQSTGIANLLGEHLFSAVKDSPLLLSVVAAAVTLTLTEFASNTASASVLIAILIGLVPVDSALGEYSAVLAACIAASYAFMLPVATPPNAIVYGTGRIELRQMLAVGAVLNIVGLLVILFFFGILGVAG